MKNLKKFVCAGVLATTALGLTSCKVVDEVKSWFDKDPVETTEETPTAIVDGVAMNGGVVNGIPKNIAFTRATSNAVSISATVNEDATNPQLSWSLAWASSNGSEQVANYVSFTTSNEGKTCTLEVKKAFNVPITLKVSTVDGSSDTCQLDYLKQVSGITLKSTYFDGTAENTINIDRTAESVSFSEHEDGSSSLRDGIYLWNTDYTATNNYYTSKFNVEDDMSFEFKAQTVGTVGTVTFNDESYCYFTLGLTEEAKNALSSAGLSQYVKADTTLEDGETMSYGLSSWCLNINSGTSATTVQQIVNTLDAVEADTHFLKTTIVSTYSGTTRTVSFTYRFSPTVMNYIPATVSIDSNVVLK